MSLMLEFIDALNKHDPTAIGILIAVVVGILTLGKVHHMD